jgi:hypothetical protein
MEKLKQEVKSLLGITLTARQVSAFERYEEALLDWNSRFNLTAIRDTGGIRSKHFLDSLSCLLVLRDCPTSPVDRYRHWSRFPWHSTQNYIERYAPDTGGIGWKKG